MSGLLIKAQGVVVYEAEGVEGVQLTKLGETVSLKDISILPQAFLSIGIEGPNDEREGMWDFLGLEIGMEVNGKLFEHSGQLAVEGMGRVSYQGGLERRYHTK